MLEGLMEGITETGHLAEALQGEDREVFQEKVTAELEQEP